MRRGRIQWVNEAYVRAVETASEGEVRERQIELLEMRQREAAAAALAKGMPFRERVHLISGGARKAHDVVVIPLEGASVGAAIDVAALETAQGELVRHVAAYERTLDRVATGVAIFGPDQRLTFFNEAYRKLWQLDADWLATKPSDGELLDRLRELSRLPEVVNYRDWKAKILSGYKTGSEYEDWWHLLDGRTIHVVSAQRPDGGLTYLYDDATERIALESRYNALIDVQRETLDSLKEGVAVFATDGRLKLFNSAFLQIWRLSRSTLKEGPHIDKIIAQCSGLYDDMATWARISRAVTGISDRRQPVAGQMIAPRPERDRLRRRAAARRRDAHHLRRRHRLQALRADADRAQRGARRRRSPQEPVHQPRLLRAANAAHQHHRLQRAARQPAHRRAQRASSASI